MFELSGNGSFLSLNALGRQPTFYSGIPHLSNLSAVREFHMNIHPSPPTGNRLSWVLERLPALETLVILETTFPPGTLCAPAGEPVLCSSLKTIAFFNCKMPEGVTKELGDVITTRRDSLATRLYRVIFVGSDSVLPGLQVAQRLRKLVPCVEVGVDDKLPDLS